MKNSKLLALLMAGGLVAAPFAASADPNNDAVSVSLSAKIDSADTTESTVTADQDEVEFATGEVDFFASAAATGALALSTSKAESGKVGATAGSVAPGVTEQLDDASTAEYDASGTATITFDLTGAPTGP